MARDNSGDGAPAAEQGEALRVLLQHCREMRRLETRSRWVSTLLLLALLGGVLWLQALPRGSKDDAPQQQVPAEGMTQKQSSEGLTPKPRHRRRTVNSIHLLTNHSQTQSAQQDGSYAVRWITPQVDSKFKLKSDKTEVVIHSRGWHLVSLRMSYNVPLDKLLDPICKKGSICYLEVSIMQINSNYPEWREVMVGKETMLCESNQYHVINLSRVIKLEKSTLLRVTVDDKNRKLINWGNENHFEVTRL